MWIDADGTGTNYSMNEIVARIDGVTGLDETTLETNGNLVTMIVS